MIDILTLLDFVLTVIGAATLLIQLIPTLDKKNKWKPALEMFGKYIALNKPVIRQYVDLALVWLKNKSR